MNKQLPPLPVPDRTMWQYGKQIDHFTEGQMLEFAALCVSQENTRAIESLRVIFRERMGAEQVREHVQRAIALMKERIKHEPCQYADECNMEGECVNGCRMKGKP